MRLSSLRALLLVLAMVAQTVAGGASIARAASMSSQQMLSGPCHQSGAGDQSGPANKVGHRHHCQSCLLCAEPPPVWIAGWSSLSEASVQYAPISFTTADSRSLTARPARSHCARAPPGAVA
jgi:hypothetical protein